MKRLIYLKIYLVILVSADIEIDDSDEIVTMNPNLNEVNSTDYTIDDTGTSLRKYRHIKAFPNSAISNKDDFISDRSLEESLEKKKAAVPIHFKKEITTTEPDIDISVNATTIKSATWKYQSNRTSEESEESKSTLIDYPFSVSIQRKGSHYATGALIDKWWVISAAGEFYNVRESLKLFRARLGSVDCKSGGVIVPLLKIEIHPFYVYRKPNFDVALLRLAKKVEFSSYIRPIAISNMKGTVLSAKFMTSYWPRVLINGVALPPTALERIHHNSMRVSTQRLIPSKDCVEIIKNIDELLNESSLCLKPIEAHHSVCLPDAGAPVIADDGLWGVTSGWTSRLCPEFPAPTIFTRLSSESVRSWLQTHLQFSV